MLSSLEYSLCDLLSLQAEPITAKTYVTPAMFMYQGRVVQRHKLYYQNKG